MSGLEKEELKLPNIFELYGYKVYIVAKWKEVNGTDKTKFYC